MNILKKIDIGENKKAAAIFYDFHIGSGAKWSKEKNMMELTTSKAQSHTEIIIIDALKSIGLNEKSFVLRFADRSPETLRSLVLTLADDSHIDTLANLAELSAGMGLQVKEHYGNLSIKKTVNNAKT